MKQIFECMVQESRNWTPPTCRGFTRNDTYIPHSSLARCSGKASVENNPAFDARSPSSFTLSLEAYSPVLRKWIVPEPWANFDVQPQNLELCYEEGCKQLETVFDSIRSAEMGEEALIEWSKTVEKAVDRALPLQHRMDPLRSPIQGLPDKAKGRCQGPMRSLEQKRPVENDKFGGYNPSNEIYKLKNRMMIKQVRRLKSLIRAVEAFQRRNPGQDVSLHASSFWQLQGE